MGIGAAISAVATFLGSGTTAAVLTLTALRIGAAVGISVLLQKQPDKPGLTRQITTKGTLDPQQIVYGTDVLVAGSLAYRNTHGRSNSQLWAVHCIAGHEIEDIGDIWLDSRVISDSEINGGAAAGGAVTTGTFGPRGGVNTVEVYKKLGTDTQTADAALDTASTQWTSAHRLRGIAYIVTMFKLNDKTQSIWEAGDPLDVYAKVRGKPVYDPRLDTSPGANPDNPAYMAASDNPALCLADYIRDAKFSPLAGGVAASRIDWDSVEAAADDCDALVPIPTASTEKRFTFNGVLYGTADPEENVAHLKSAMNGDLIFSGGKYYISAGVWEAPTDSLSEDDIIGKIGITSALASDRRVNTMKANYIDRNKLYEPTDTAPITIAAYKNTRDNGDELVDTIELPGTQGNYMAQRICLKRLYQADEEDILTIPCTLNAARFVPGDRINLTITERGWTPRIFRVLEWEMFDRGADKVGVNLVVRQDQSAAYNDPAEGDYNTITPGGKLIVAQPALPINNYPNFMPQGWASLEGTRLQNSGSWSDWSITTDRAYFGTQSLHSFPNNNNDTSVALRPKASTVKNLRIPPNRRWILQVRIFPVGLEAASANVAYFASMSLTTSISSGSIGGDELTAGEWNLVRLEIDATADNAQEGVLEINKDWIGGNFQNQIVAFDEFLLIDATDDPGIIEEVVE